MKIIESKHSAKLDELIGPPGLRLLKHGLGAVDRILPHMQASSWTIGQVATNAGIVGNNAGHAELNVGLLPTTDGTYSYHAHSSLVRKQGSSSKNVLLDQLDEHEKFICQKTSERISGVLRVSGKDESADTLRAIEELFDEQLVASAVRGRIKLNLDMSSIFAMLRALAEQSYENKSLTCGCIIDANDNEHRGVGTAQFPRALGQKKRYRVLADGYYTAYKVSSRGRMKGLVELQRPSKIDPKEAHHYPTWCEGMAHGSRGHNCGVSLTRQGDILVFTKGSLTYSYRSGKWQYWNHDDLLRMIRERVVSTSDMFAKGALFYIYDAALDVSFRRSGGVFVVLKKREDLKELVDPADRIGDENRSEVDSDFDRELQKKKFIYNISRQVMVRLAGLDGAVVTGPDGELLAYGAILRVPKDVDSGREEGSRTKAAVAASHFGIAVKISSDGDVKCYENGKSFLAF